MRCAGIIAAFVALTASPVQACGLFDWLFHRDEQPVVTGHPCCPPVNPCNPCDPCGGNCGSGVVQPMVAQPTTVGFRGPVYRSIFAPVPVTAYRPVAAGPALAGCQTCTTMTQRVPVTTSLFSPLWRPSVYGYNGAQTAYYAPVYGQTSMYAPAAVQANYAQPVWGRDHAYEGLGPTHVAMPAVAVPAVAPTYMTQPGCSSCGKIPVTAGYPPVMGPTTNFVSPSTASPSYPTSSYPANGYPAGAAVTTPATNGAAPVLNGAAPILNGAAPASVPANMAPALKPLELQPMAPLNGSGLVPVGPAANGVNYPKAAVPTPNLNLRPLPDLDPPLPPTVKPAPPLLQPGDKTAMLPTRRVQEVQWASEARPIEAAAVAPALHMVPAGAAPKAIEWDSTGWRAAKD